MIKNIITTIMAILALGFIASNASAAASTWAGTAGDTITISADAVDGATEISFTPSAQVSISGGSDETAFAILAGHGGVQGKEVGQNYGMASDSSVVFWLSASTEYAAISDTNSGAFDDYNR